MGIVAFLIKEEDRGKDKRKEMVQRRRRRRKGEKKMSSHLRKRYCRMGISLGVILSKGNGFVISPMAMGQQSKIWLELTGMGLKSNGKT